MSKKTDDMNKAVRAAADAAITAVEAKDADAFAKSVGELNRLVSKAKSTSGVEIPARAMNNAKDNIEQAVMWFTAGLQEQKRPSV